MEEYQMIEELGTGSFGTVFKSKLKITGEIVIHFPQVPLQNKIN